MPLVDRFPETISVTLPKSNMNTEPVTSVTDYQSRKQPAPDLNGMKLIRVSFGTFAGVQERLILVERDGLVAFDTGDQGAGQN